MLITVIRTDTTKEKHIKVEEKYEGRGVVVVTSCIDLSSYEAMATNTTKFTWFAKEKERKKISKARE